MNVEKMVAIFLYIISHHANNRIIKREFVRSGETNCLDTLDGTYIKVNALEIDKPRYKTRKNEIATNVLGVCSQDMQFIYILPGWKGSASDSRVLRDAISRRNGLKIPKGFFYLRDVGDTNGEEFLTPYRGQRYHLNEWRQNRTPRSKEELFNYKHSGARNVIERCFGFLKMRWMEVASSQGLGRTSKKSTHQWTPIEDGVLIDCCIDLVNEVGVEIMGHSSLKTQYREIAEMISHSDSGFGWDDVKKCVTCDDDVWIGWVKSHSAAAGLRNKPFPHFDQLAIIFGKDKATGEGAESPADAVENIETEEVAFAATRVASKAFSALNDDEDNNGDDDVSPAQATNSEGSIAARRRTIEQGDRKVSGKKSKAKSNGDNIVHAFQSNVDKIGEICQGAREGIDKLASCFQFMAEDARLKKRVAKIVQGVEGLTPEEIVKARHIISSDIWKINYLFSLLEELQKIYVKPLLSGSI
ncbi:Uncharacterized protein TCM_017450 [Theobroma cacao]|uniref:DDE Tnp4 domain-containing protein n=1 Tax=Theobroma cacao TaxID=3641 RepID=A0A061EDH8_THECC|nr:Uncharacterized protein TCM_017450 [Theobroma cacao]